MRFSDTSVRPACSQLTFLVLSLIASILGLSLSVHAADLPPVAPSSPAPVVSSGDVPTPAPAATTVPNPANNPVLANYLKLGARLFYLGNRSGLDGWFVLRDNEMQVAYATADAQNIIVGSMWDTKGQNVTNAQVANLESTNKEVLALLNGMQQNPPTAGVSLPPEVAAAAKELGVAPSVPAGASPGEKLMVDLQTLAGVTVGNASAPVLMMVMDPNCPHCQATWKLLRDAVFKNTIQVRLIPIANVDTDNERAAGELLQVADPLNAWDKYVGGDKGQLAGTPSSHELVALHANHIMTDSWRINTTPTLVYRGKDGKVKIVLGEPHAIDAVLNDMAP